MGNKKLKSRRVLVKEFSKDNGDFLQLYGIYKDTIDYELTYAKFLQLYYDKNLVLIDFTLFSHQNKRVGFSAAFFYSSNLKGKPSFIARSATGLIKDLQGKGLHSKLDLYIKFIRFALFHPLKPIWVAAFIVNAFVFSELCRYVPAFFPHPGKQVPEDIENIIHEIIIGSGHQRNVLHPYSVSVPIQVNFNENLLKRIYDSDNSNVQWYLKENPGFLEKYGLFVIIRVSFKNIYGTIMAFVKRFCHNILSLIFLFIRNVTNPVLVLKPESLKKSFGTILSFGKSLCHNQLALFPLIVNNSAEAVKKIFNFMNNLFNKWIL